MTDPDWRATNRAHWESLAAIHLAPGGYDLSALRAGAGRLDPILEAELGPVAGLRVLHLQCHIGDETLTLAQRGATVTGLDASAIAIGAARRLAAELGLSDRAHFVEADLYRAAEALPEPGGFDLVLVTWGSLCWLPDLAGWARIVAGFLRPGGRLHLAEGHPAALVFDDRAPGAAGKPGWLVPYFEREAVVLEEEADYANPAARPAAARSVTWMHPLSAVVGALRGAGLALDWLHEHPRVAWRMFRALERDADGLWAFPDRPWLPLAYSLGASRPLWPAWQCSDFGCGRPGPASPPWSGLRRRAMPPS
ncbi:class I SAM-dependent methyltransferase [Roseicella aquatilis]|nr:class I SAM-dependent methyltransferase [Roseicella aquatilis]